MAEAAGGGDPYVGGPAQQTPVVLVPYDAAWPARYREVADRVRTALGPRALRVEHIGSTSVPGLVAKPIVDVLLVVQDAADEDAYLPALERAGFVLRVREPASDQHRMLRTPDRGVHLHVYPAGSTEIDRYLLLRGLLRADPAARARYAGVKRRLATQDWPTMDDYADAKSEVVEALIAEARARGIATGRLRGSPGADPTTC